MPVGGREGRSVGGAPDAASLWMFCAAAAKLASGVSVPAFFLLDVGDLRALLAGEEPLKSPFFREELRDFSGGRSP